MTPDKKIAFKIPKLDQLLRGGIRIRGINEISGEAGSGKTQLAMHLALTVQFPVHLGGLGKKAIYISTEGPIPTQRLYEMSMSLKNLYVNEKDIWNNNFLDNIICVNVQDSDTLKTLLKCKIPLLLEKEPIGLIIIDSIAAVFRTTTNYIGRAYDFRTIVTTLNHFSKKYQLGIVIVNQVRLNNSVPALGLAWANLVSTRIQIFKQSNISPLAPKNIQYRIFKVTWAPNVPIGRTTFLITTEGIK